VKTPKVIMDLDGWQVRYDGLSYELAVRRNRRKSKGGDLESVFMPVSWHRTLYLALESYLHKKLPHHAHTRREAASVIQAQREILEEIKKACDRAQGRA